MLSDVNVSSNCNRFTINHERQRCGLLSNDFDHLFNWYSFLKLLQVGTHPKNRIFWTVEAVFLQTRRPSHCSTNSVKEKKEIVIDRVKDFLSHSTQNMSFWTRSPSQSLGLVWKTEPDTTKAHIHQTKEMYYNIK